MSLQDENNLLKKQIAKLKYELTLMKSNLIDTLIDNDLLREEVRELEDKLKEQQED
jgi:regulator of replication initiation timing